MPLIKAVLYARYSSAHQREESIVHQVEKIEEFAAQNQIEIVAEYTDEAQSGASDRRISFQKMIADAHHADWQFIIVYKMDRLSRNVADALHYKKLLEKQGIQIISVIENFDGDTPEGGFFNLITMGMAEFYIKNLARESRAGLMQNARRAMATGGVPPFGYDIDKEKRYVINEHEAKGARLMFQWVAEEMSYREIAKRLNSMGYRNKLGRPFRGYFYDLLRNRKYIGEFTYNRTIAKTKEGKRNTHRSKAENEIVRIPNAIPAIIDEDLFNKVQVIMDQRKQHQPFPRSTSKYLLTGRLQCRHCGYAMFGNITYTGRSKAPYFTYTCKSKQLRTCETKAFNMLHLDRYVMDWLKESLFDLDNIKQVQDNCKMAIQTAKSEWELKQNINTNRINEIQETVKTLTEQMLTSGKISEITISQQIEELLQEQRELMIENERLQKDINNHTTATKDVIEKSIKGLKKIILSGDKTNSRLGLRRLIYKILVDNKGVTIQVNVRTLIDCDGTYEVFYEHWQQRSVIYAWRYL